METHQKSLKCLPRLNCHICHEEISQCKQLESREIVCHDCYDSLDKCSDCYQRFLPAELEKLEGKLFCSICQGKLEQCYDCQRYIVDDEDTYTLANDEEVCSDCRKHYRRCSDCELLYDRNDLSDGLCENCLENYGTCYSCSERIPNDDLFYDDSTAENYCESCYDSLREESIIKEFTTNPLDYLSKLPTKNILLGVELEVGIKKESNHDIEDKAREVLDELGDSNVILKYDCSITEDKSLSAGFEIVSRPADLENQKSIFEPLFEIKGLVSFDTTSCGLHVHIDRSRLTQLQIGKMLVFLNNRENLPFIEAIAQRKNNSYCEIKYKKIISCKKSDSRFEALNLQNAATVEMRIFKGTLVKESFYKSIEFADALVHFCAIGNYSIAHATDYRVFIEYIKEERKKYNNLYHFLQEKEYIPKEIKKERKEKAVA